MSAGAKENDATSDSQGYLNEEYPQKKDHEDSMLDCSAVAREETSEVLIMTDGGSKKSPSKLNSKYDLCTVSGVELGHTVLNPSAEVLDDHVHVNATETQHITAAEEDKTPTVPISENNVNDELHRVGGVEHQFVDTDKNNTVPANGGYPTSSTRGYAKEIGIVVEDVAMDKNDKQIVTPTTEESERKDAALVSSVHVTHAMAESQNNHEEKVETDLKNGAQSHAVNNDESSDLKETAGCDQEEQVRYDQVLAAKTEQEFLNITKEMLTSPEPLVVHAAKSGYGVSKEENESKPLLDKDGVPEYSDSKSTGSNVCTTDSTKEKITEGEVRVDNAAGRYGSEVEAKESISANDVEHYDERVALPTAVYPGKSDMLMRETHGAAPSKYSLESGTEKHVSLNETPSVIVTDLALELNTNDPGTASGKDSLLEPLDNVSEQPAKIGSKGKTPIVRKKQYEKEESESSGDELCGAGNDKLDIVESYMAVRSGEEDVASESKETSDEESDSVTSVTASSYSSNCSLCQDILKERIAKKRVKARIGGSESSTESESHSGTSYSSDGDSAFVVVHDHSVTDVKEKVTPQGPPMHNLAVRFNISQTADHESTTLPRSPWPGKRSREGSAADIQEYDSVKKEENSDGKGPMETERFKTRIETVANARNTSDEATKDQDSSPAALEQLVPHPTNKQPTEAVKVIKASGPYVVTFSSSLTSKGPNKGTLSCRLVFESSAPLTSVNSDALGNLKIFIDSCAGLDDATQAGKVSPYVKVNVLQEGGKSTPFRGKTGLGNTNNRLIVWGKDLIIRNIPASTLRNGTLKISVMKREIFSDKCLASSEIELHKQERFGPDVVTSTAEWLIARREPVEGKVILQ